MVKFRAIAVVLTGAAALGLGGGVGLAVAQAQEAVGVTYQGDAPALGDRQQQAPVANVTTDRGARFAQLSPATDEPQGEQPHRIELEVSTPPNPTGFNVSVAQRASMGANAAGDLNRNGSGSEVRIGRALGDPSRGGDAPNHRIYAFAASDNQALTWQPGHGSVSLEGDRVEVGDRQAGVTYERGNMQASVALVQRKTHTRVGHQSFGQDESFAGVTLTMRH